MSLATPPRQALVLASGASIRIRPIESADREGQAALFERLSPRSRRRRFLIAKKVLTGAELSYFTEIDHVQHEALVAINQADNLIVGVSRYAALAARVGAAELAIEVADDAQNQRIGTALLAPTLLRAGENGFALLAATTHADNWPARALLRRYGFSVHERDGEHLHLELVLSAPPRRRPGS